MTVTNLNDQNNSQPTSPIRVDRLVAGIVDEVNFVDSDDQGNFSHPTNIDQSLAGQQIEYKFTNLETSEVVSRFYDLPPLSDVPLNLIFPTTIYTGSDQYGSYQVFPGVAITGEITAPDNSQFSDLSKPGVVNSSNDLNISFPLGTPEGIYQAEISAIGYPKSATASIDVIYGFEIELITPDGLVFPGDNHTISLKGKPNITVDVTAFGVTNQVTLDANGDGVATITIPANPTFGTETANIVVPDFPFSVTADLRVDNPTDYILSANFPDFIPTNGGETPEVTGLALPGKIVTVSIPELSYSDTATSDINGDWKAGLPTFSWQASGTFNISASSPGETTVNGTGNHKPQIEIVSQPQNIVQGSLETAFDVRGDANSQVVVTINNQSITYSTNSTGLATAIFPAIPLLIEVPVSFAVVVSHPNPPLLSDDFEVQIDARVPLSVVIANSETIGDVQDLLFVDTQYTITGNAPGQSIASSQLSLIPVGNLANFSFDSHDNDLYSATITTGSEPSQLTITASVPNQPIEVSSYQIVYPLSLTVPQGEIKHDDLTLTITATTTPNIPVTLTWQYLDDEDNVIFSQNNTLISDNNGDSVFNIAPLNIAQAIQIKFIAQVSTAYQIEEIRDYQSELGAIVGLPFTRTDIIANFGDPYTGSHYWGNSNDNFNYYLETLGIIEREGVYANDLDLRGSYLNIELRNNFNDLDCKLKTLQPDYSWLNNNGYTCLFTFSFHDSVQVTLPFVTLVEVFDNLRISTLNTIQQAAASFNFSFFDVLDCVVVFKISDSDNNGNSSCKLFINNQLVFNIQGTSVVDASTFNSTVFATWRAGRSNRDLVLPNIILLQKTLTDSEVFNSYQANGIRKKLRRSTMADFARQFAFSAYAGDDQIEGLYEESTDRYGFLPLASERPEPPTGFYQVANPLSPQKDSEGRNFISFDGQSCIELGTPQITPGFLLVISRSVINNQKQVIVDIRRNIFVANSCEIAFDGINNLTVSAFYTNSTVIRTTYTSDQFATQDILCCYFVVNSNPNNEKLIVNGVEVTTKTRESINSVGLTIKNTAVTLGSKYEKTDYFTGRFYGLFSANFPGGAGNQVQTAFPGSSVEQLTAFWFWIMGFRQPMLNVDPNFVLLNQIDGFSYI